VGNPQGRRSRTERRRRRHLHYSLFTIHSYLASARRAPKEVKRLWEGVGGFGGCKGGYSPRAAKPQRKSALPTPYLGSSASRTSLDALRHTSLCFTCASGANFTHLKGGYSPRAAKPQRKSALPTPYLGSSASRTSLDALRHTSLCFTCASGANFTHLKGGYSQRQKRSRPGRLLFFNSRIPVITSRERYSSH